MSGNAALSAARKRRASSSPGVPGSGGGGGGFSSPQQQTNGSYYSGNNVQNIQAMMNQPPAGGMSKQALANGQNLTGSLGINVPPVPINMYENIELIKQQIEARTKIIQTQGSTIPADKLKILHKQNEVQTQILKQRMLMLQEMEMSAANQQAAAASAASAASAAANSRLQRTTPSKNEPQFIYEKGIPRPNPNYNSVTFNENVITHPHTVPVVAPVQAPAPAPVNTPMSQRNVAPSFVTPSRATGNLPTAILTPFVSMITSTGVTPPPLVILKSHDEKIGEHDAVLNDLTNRINYIHSCVDELSSNTTNHRTQPVEHAEETGDETGEETGDETGDETELLMDTVMNDLINSRDFVQGIVDKIVNETNLSETIMKIEPIIRENQELRSLIHSQQKMINEMNTMVLRLLNQQHDVDHEADDTADNNHMEETNEQCNIDENGLYQTENVVPIHSYIVPNMDNAVMTICIDTPELVDAVDALDAVDVDTDAMVAIDAAADAVDVDAAADATVDVAATVAATVDVDAVDAAVDAAYAEIHEYENEPPHFPSDSRIALVINEI